MFSTGITSSSGEVGMFKKSTRRRVSAFMGPPREPLVIEGGVRKLEDLVARAGTYWTHGGGPYRQEGTKGDRTRVHAFARPGVVAGATGSVVFVFTSTPMAVRVERIVGPNERTPLEHPLTWDVLGQAWAAFDDTEQERDAVDAMMAWLVGVLEGPPNA